MRVVGAVLYTLGACSFSPNAATQPEDDAGTHHGIDAGSDGSNTQPPADARACFGGGLATVCVNNLPMTLAKTQINTDADCTLVFTPPGGRALCVMAAQSIDLSTDVRANGSRPLVLLAATTFVLETGHQIDVSSRDGSNPGAGANDSACVAPNNPEGDTGGGGGGAGGSFQGKGGDGGLGDGNDNSGNDGTADPGLATAAVPLSFVRGGCKGGKAGGASPNTLGADGGNGGGAVYIVAGDGIEIRGTVQASGAGAPGSGNIQGGAGGGAGGFIGFDAPTITLSGIVAANGGGGARGGSNSSHGGGGGKGDDGGITTSTPPAGGQTGGSDAGAAGNGSVGTTLDGSPGGKLNGGGGGGGGGAGFIYTHGTVAQTGQRSPS